MGSYGDYLGKDFGKLGFGFMRLPKLGDGKIDIEQTKLMVDTFMEAGLTYFDTAYVYDGGDSERALKAALIDRYPRDSFTVATKMNAWLGSPTEEEVKKQFEISLERTGAGYFDFYLLHAIQNNNIDVYENYHLFDYVRQLKAEGKIKHWGFSFHGTPELLDKLLTEHTDVEFIQLQINYADWNDETVASGRNVAVATKHKVPFVIMEPVKGGNLANPPAPVAAVLKAANPDVSNASWAIRFAASLDGCIATLSGMSNLAQVQDNVSYMKEFKPLTQEEQDVIKKAQEELAKIEQIKCTACHYCVAGCPVGMRIPEIFAAMNKYLMNDMMRAPRDFAKAIDGAAKPSECLSCGQCEGACPQSLPIISLLARCADALE